MLVKKMMVLGKLLTILVLTANTALADTTNEPISALGGVRSDYDQTGSPLGIIFNFAKYAKYSLNKQDRQKHIETMIFALENLDNGEVVEWHNVQDDTHGRIKMIYGYDISGGYCRKMFTEVRIKDRYRDYEEQGCRTVSSNYWNFSR